MIPTYRVVDRQLWALRDKLRKAREGISQEKEKHMEGMKASPASGGGSRPAPQAYTAAEAAKEIGVAERTFLKWVRRYAVLPEEHSGVEFSVDDVLHVMSLTKDHPFATKEGKKVKTIDTSKVKLRPKVKAKKAAKAGKTVPVPDQGSWTPTRRERKGFLKSVGIINREKASESLALGLVPATTVGRVLGYNPTAINAWVRREHIRPAAIFKSSIGKRACVLFTPKEAEKAATKMGHLPRKSRTVPHPNQLGLFDQPSPAAAACAAPNQPARTPKALKDPGSISKLVRPMTPEEIKTALAHVPREKQAAASALLDSGKFTMAQVAGPMIGVHPTTVRNWFNADKKRKAYVEKGGRLLFYPIFMIEELAKELLPKGEPSPTETVEVAIEGGIKPLGVILGRYAKVLGTMTPDEIKKDDQARLVEKVALEVLFHLFRGIREGATKRGLKI